MVKIISRITRVLKDYCLNSSLAGLSYIADPQYHYSERLFWLACVIFSWIGSANLIIKFMESFNNNSVSVGVVSLRPTETVAFPSAGICEMGYPKESYKELENLVNEMRFKLDDGETVEYNYDAEDFLMRVIFHNLYNFGSMTSYCSPYDDCTDCMKCPSNNYQVYADRVRSNCSQLFFECKWNGVPFDCCRYFRPVRTTLGTCFLMNSIQAVKKYGPNWLNMKVGMQEGNGNLEISVTKSSGLYILNEEDIPHMLLTTLHFPQIPDGFDGDLLLAIKDIQNGKSVRTISPEQRKCMFPDEPFDSPYLGYSFSTCVTECIKRIQIKICNCSHYNLIVDKTDKSPECDYEGLGCLDRNHLLFPQTRIMQPWRTDGDSCYCLPSCNELQISVVGLSSGIMEDTNIRKVSIRLQQIPTQRYFRQAVREKIDIVVSIGGILGLFMGASILSLVEFIYFFTIRNCRAWRNNTDKH